MHCNAPQRTATHRLRRRGYFEITATRCNTLQHTATYCNTLQHTGEEEEATFKSLQRCNMLQHTATHCNALQHTGEEEEATFKSLASGRGRVEIEDVRSVLQCVAGCCSVL